MPIWASNSRRRGDADASTSLVKDRVPFPLHGPDFRRLKRMSIKREWQQPYPKANPEQTNAALINDHAASCFDPKNPSA
jgi:hypothetical protein